jgi:subtilisin-like proprotein convertase family protein
MRTQIPIGCFLFFIWFIMSSVVVHAETFVSTDVPKAIPDGPAGTAESQLSIPVNRVIVDMNVTVRITHEFDGDLGLYLLGPGGAVVRLAFRVGHDGHNFTNTTFDDEATTPIATGSAPFSGSFIPDQSLTQWDGAGTIGVWVLRVTDFAANDTGRLQAWQLTFMLGDTLAALEPPVFQPKNPELTAYPNPFNASTRLHFQLAAPGRVTIELYDVAGRTVSTLVNAVYPAGEQQYALDASALPTGVYFARLQAGNTINTAKLLLVK